MASAKKESEIKPDEEYFPFKKEWLFAGLLLGPPVAIFFAVTYYLAHKSPILVAVLLLYALTTLVSVFLLQKSLRYWKIIKHLLAVVIIFAASGTYLTQTDSPEQMVWFISYPTILLFLMGLKNGILYDLLLFGIYIFGYHFPVFLGHDPHIPDKIIFHAFAAGLILASLVGYYQFRVEKYHNELEHRAFYDQLTGALNRHWIETRINEEIVHLNRTENAPPFSIILFDLDDFKKINDTMGHQAGDNVLKETVSSSRKHLRKNDYLARWGGEEFIVFLRATDKQAALEVAEKLRGEISRTLFFPDRESSGRPVVTASFGVATHEKGTSLEKITARADEFLYLAKAGGKNRIHSG